METLPCDTDDEAERNQRQGYAKERRHRRGRLACGGQPPDGSDEDEQQHDQPGPDQGTQRPAPWRGRSPIVQDEHHHGRRGNRDEHGDLEDRERVAEPGDMTDAEGVRSARGAAFVRGAPDESEDDVSAYPDRVHGDQHEPREATTDAPVGEREQQMDEQHDRDALPDEKTDRGNGRGLRCIQPVRQPGEPLCDHQPADPRNAPAAVDEEPAGDVPPSARQRSDNRQWYQGNVIARHDETGGDQPQCPTGDREGNRRGDRPEGDYGGGCRAHVRSLSVSRDRRSPRNGVARILIVRAPQEPPVRVTHSVRNPG